MIGAARRFTRQPGSVQSVGRGPEDPAQSLSDGELGRMLFAVELATISSKGSWDEVTDRLLAATRMPLDRSEQASLFYGRRLSPSSWTPRAISAGPGGRTSSPTWTGFWSL